MKTLYNFVVRVYLTGNKINMKEEWSYPRLQLFKKQGLIWGAPEDISEKNLFLTKFRNIKVKKLLLLLSFQQLQLNLHWKCKKYFAYFQTRTRKQAISSFCVFDFSDCKSDP